METLILIFFFALGAIVASFVGVIAERTHTGHSFLKGRSRCDSCAVTLSPLDLVPVLSWLFSLGRCRKCGSKVPARHIVNEAVLGSAFALSYHLLGFTLLLPVLLAALSFLFFIVLYDLRHTIVPMGAASALIALSVLYAALSTPSLPELVRALGAAGLVAFFFLALYLLSRGRAMGLGDAPVAFALALIAHGYALPGLLLSFWIGAAYGIAVLVTRRGGPKMGIEVPFVPFLAAGFLLAYFFQWNPFFLPL